MLRYVLKKVCMRQYTEQMCQLLLDNVVTIEGQNVAHAMDPVIICSSLNLCSSPKIVADTRSAYINRVLHDLPPIDDSLPPKSRSGLPPLRMLVFTDPHIEFDYEEARS